MTQEFSQAELEAYLDEALDAERAAAIEQAVRANPLLLKNLTAINSRRDSGVHTLGEIWRRNQIGVPSREDLGSYLLGVLAPEKEEYVRFRLNVLKCPFTIANLKDLQREQEEKQDIQKNRRRKFLNSSSEYLSE